MKQAVAPEHFHFFDRHHSIEFESLITEEQLLSAESGLGEILSPRLMTAPSMVKTAPSESLFMEGRDLWRLHPAFKGITLQKSLAEVAGTLLGQRPIRIGYDQLIPSFSDQLPHYLSQPQSLSQISSIQGVVGGLILCIQGNEELSSDENALFSTKVGHGVFINAEREIDFSELLNRPGCLYLLVVYTHSITAYIHKQEDPHTYALKDWGYEIGDPLTNVKNPLVFK